MRWISSETFFFFLFPVHNDKLITFIQSRTKYGQGWAEAFFITLIFTLVSKIVRLWPTICLLNTPLSARTLTFKHCLTVWNFIPCFLPNSWLPKHSAEVQWEKIGSAACRLSRFQTVTKTNAAIKSPTGLSLRQQSPSAYGKPDPQCMPRSANALWGKKGRV